MGPTVAGFEAALNKVCGETYPKTGKIIWINMRQEPDVYVNGEPVCARPANKIGEYAELGNVTRDSAKATEVKFLEECAKRIAGNGGKLKVVDINKKESEKEVKEILSLSKVIENMKDFKGNLGTIIHDIYQTAHLMFGDMPQGDHKKRAKYRFASKTLMRLLPKELLGQVEGLIEKKTITLDLYDILGQCTWGQK